MDAGQPVRTCVGCRQRAPKAELSRLALVREPVSGSERAFVVPDVDNRLPGRGVYLHPGRPECLAAALRSKAFARAFRAPVDASRLPESFGAIS
jgi:predicted RNA-binding protein YlxR (DUF448 family)